MKFFRTLLPAALVLAACLGTALAQRQVTVVSQVELPLKLPAVGNFDAVQKWQFGRIESIEHLGSSGDIVLRIRIPNGTVLRVVGPGPQLNELARKSDWYNPNKQVPAREDYVERQVAFDVDGNGRLIAMISLEPMRRDRNRLRRALDTI